MKKIILIAAAPLLLPPLACLAQSLQGERRIEEEKRKDLRPTEVAAPAPSTTPPSSLDRIDQDYLMEFLLRRVTFRRDLCKVMVLLFGVENEYISLDSQIAFLKESKLLPKRVAEDFRPTEPLRKGLAAYVFYRALDIKGGLIITVLGVNERYALKELSYQGIMSSGNTNDIVSGDELISALTLAARHLSQQQTEKTGAQK